MSRPNPLILISILALLGGGLSWLSYSTGVYYLSEHEGDTVHLLDILFRMYGGAIPHLDFVTPLGILSFLPFTTLMEAGYSVGQSILFGQILVAAILAPVVLYVAWTRLSSFAGYAFVGLAMILLLAISYGGTSPGTSMSMYYNRWAWVVASCLVFLAIVPSRRPVPVLDGALAGILLSLLALTKITFCLMLLPGVMVALLLQGRRSEFYVIFATGLVAIAGVALWLGVDFWTAYAANLLNVSSSEVRPHTGLPLTHIIAAPDYLPMTAVGFLTYLFLARAGHRPQAIGVLFLLPGFFIITWQNFGNDPVWLIPVLIILLTYAAQPETDESGYAPRIMLTAVLAGMFILPWGLTMAISPLRHATQDATMFEPVFPNGGDKAEDIFVRRDRGYSMLAQVFYDDPGDVWDDNQELIDRPTPREIGGLPFPQCEFMAGSTNWLRIIASDLEELGVEPGAQLFTTDVLTSFWLYGPYEPLQNGAPWYYSDLSGIENADYLVVPKCGFAERVRQLIIQDVIDSDLTPVLFAETDRVAVFRLP